MKPIKTLGTALFLGSLAFSGSSFAANAGAGALPIPVQAVMEPTAPASALLHQAWPVCQQFILPTL